VTKCSDYEDYLLYNERERERESRIVTEDQLYGRPP